MSTSDDSGILASSESFWEIGQYKRTVKRIEDGSKLCHDLMTLIKERGDIETAYAKQLRCWSKKWQETLEKGPEYGTMQSAWNGVLDEADKRCDLHVRVRDRLLEEVYNTVKLWQKENFHQKALGGLKECKELEEAFRKAQKPWAKLYAKVDKAKKEYHAACKAEKSAITQEKNAQGDSSVSADHAKKLADRVERLREDKDKAKSMYDGALKEINDYNAKYMEDMTQEYSPEFRRITKKQAKVPATPGSGDSVEATSSDGVTLIGQKQVQTTPTSSSTSESATTTTSRPTITLVQNGHSNSVPNGPFTANQQPSSTGGGGGDQTPHSPSPFDGDWDEPDGTLVDSGEKGEPVKALYDYTAQEDDELSLKKGDTFEKLEDEDEQGWCKGRKDGRVGLYPANYAVAVN